MKRVSNWARRAGDAHVAAEGEVHPGADRRAVDGGDRRQRAAGDAQEPLVDATETLPVGLGQVAQVGAGTERRRRPGDDDGADRLVGLEGVHRRHDLVDHRRRQRVALVGVVQRERGDAVGDLGEHVAPDLQPRPMVFWGPLPSPGPPAAIGCGRQCMAQ